MDNKEVLEVKKVFPAMVVRVLDFNEKVVINRGADHGVKMGQRFLIYRLDEEILDPETNQSLGRLELVRGTGKVVHIQEKMATIESDQTTAEKTIRKSGNTMWKSFGASEEEIIKPSMKPFDDPQQGDLAKPI